MPRLLGKIFIALSLCMSYTSAYAVLKADFTISGGSGCAPVVASFSNASTGAVSYVWSFGNGNTSTSVNPGAIYTNPGSYTVQLVAKDASGNTDTMTKTAAITVFQNPAAGFTTNINSGCAPLQIVFTDTTTSGSGAITSWKWDFGDGSVSTAQSPIHLYNNPGSYSISLVVDNAAGCKSTVVRTNAVTAAQKPQINFLANQTQFCDSIGAVNFTDNSTSEIAGKTTWLWRFGDGATSTLQNPSHTYKGFGSYNVTLVVNVSGGCVDSVKRIAYVILNKFTYNFSASITSGCGLFSVKFTNLTTPFYGWQAYTWDFGDGTTSNFLNPSHIYLDSGSYDVKLLVNGTADGCKDTVLKKKYINVGQQPTAKFSASDSSSCKMPFTVTFNNASNNSAATYEWDFGDGGTSTAKNPTHTYNTYGSFTVRLIAKTIEGCPDTLIATNLIQVVQPKAIINAPIPRGCKADNTILFFDNSSSLVPITKWVWYFGDGDTSHSQSPFHHYADTGKFTVSLVVTTKDSCSDSATYIQPIKIGLKPTASFVASPQDSCIQYMNVQFHTFSDTFKIKPDQYLWDFGDGASVNTQNPKHDYNDKPQSYSVKLVVFANGCTDTMIRTNYIKVHGPKANFNFFQKPCVADSVYFTNTTLGGNKYIWNFGDGSSSPVKNPAHWYSVPGTYTVNLQAFDTVKGCFNDTNFNVTITNLNKYKAGFTNTTATGCYPVSVNFTDTTFTAQSWSWDLGNGQFSKVSNPTATYTEPGLYTVKLSVVNGQGCTVSTTQQNIVKAFGVVPSFDICSAQQCGAGPVKFTDFTRAPDPISKRDWTFGDGNSLTTTDSTVTHTYSGILPNQLNGYTVRLTVKDSAGCSAFTESKIRQTKPFQLIDKSIRDNCGSEIITLSPINTISTGVTPYVYTWKWENDAPVVATVLNKTIFVSGTYHIKLNYTDYYGCSDSAFDSVVVNVKTPKAGFNQSDTFSGCPPLEVQFTDTTTLGNAAIRTWLWTFGDGTSSTFQNPKKLYVLPGKYTVTLVIQDAAGCTSVASKTSIVHVKGPTGTYSFSPILGCDSAVVTFVASSSNANKLQWDLGDGTVVNDSNFKHTYFQKNITTNGVYVPRLILGDTLGCSYFAPAFDTVRVWAKELIKISVDSFACDTGLLQFSDSTHHINKAVSWFWDFGDGDTSTLQNPLHRYSTYDTFTVKLKITDSTGCSDSIIKKKWIAVSKQILPNFGTSLTGVCAKQAIVFSDSSISKKFPIVKHLWNFGDGDTSTLAQPTHTYITGGIYNVQLTVTNAHGCKDSITKSITVKTQPIAKLVTSDNCAKDTSILLDSSVSTAGTLATRIIYFGDGDSTLETGVAKYMYKKFGTYQAKLIVTSSFGCIDSAKQVLHIFQKPTAGFTVSPACQYDSLAFTDTSKIDSGTVNAWQWDFGDGSTSVLQNPKHLYASDGNYTVRLIAGSNKSCADTAIRHVTVYPKPKAKQTFSAVCKADSARFVDISGIHTGTIIGWFWSFGDGSANTVLQDPAHLYTTPGDFNIIHAVISDKGCSDTAKVVITIHPMPQPGFTKSNICYGHAVNFTDTSSIFSGSNKQWIWYFGDGDTSMQHNPAHAFATAGTFKIKQVVVSQFGCKDSITDSVIIFPKPKAGFGATTACFKDSTKFSDSSKITTGNITGWTWDFGDGAASSLQSPTHKYAASGSYTVRLIIGSDKGCGDTVTHAVTVNPRPISGFSFHNECVSDTVFFVDSAKISSGSIVSYHWDFGDGASATTQNTKHKYPLTSLYNAREIVVSDKGCHDTISAAIIIYPLPKAGFKSVNVCEYDSMNFINTSHIIHDTTTAGVPLIDSIKFTWNFGDGTSDSLVQSNHKYPTDGTYKVRLVAYSFHHCFDTATKTVRIFPKPKAKVSFSAVCQVDSAHFKDLSTIHTGNVTAWNWNFGDGSAASTLENPAHLFTNPGNFNIRLAIASDSGCVDTTINTLTIHPMPQPGFIKSNICFGNPVSFTDTSKIASGSNTQWIWDFGDGSTSNVKNPVHAFAHFGTFKIKEVVVSQFGCKDSALDSVTIYPKPKASFGANTACFNDTTFFHDSSTIGSGNIISWTWDLGDGSSSTLKNPFHLYGANGTYSVKLIITTDKGCGDTITKNVGVFPKPKSKFSFANSCKRDSVLFTNSSLVSSGAITTSEWDFGDGSVSTKTNPYHLYASPGNYTVRLIIVSDKSCSDTSTQTITIYPMPKAGFTSISICPYDSMVFTNTSTILSGTLSYSWNFGDGQTSALTSPKHKFATDGIYSVMVVAISDKGCRDTFKSNVTVYPRPKSAFTTANVCKVDSMHFTDKSTVKSGSVLSWNWDFGDGSTSTKQNPVHLFSASGTYTIRLAIFSDKGCADTSVQNLTVYPEPKAGFIAANVCYGNAANFKDISTVSSGSVVKWVWDFGDLTVTSALQNPSHNYKLAGTYSGKLVVTTGFGCKDSIVKTIVINPKPHANFSASTPCYANPTVFIDSSLVKTGNLKNWAWTFGDGGSSNVQNPTHIYLAGTYTPQLIVGTDSGCLDTFKLKAIVNPKPKSLYKVTDVCQVDSAVFLNQSTVATGSLTSYSWDFGDGNTSVLINPKHKFTAPGTYKVTLYAHTDKGCIDTSVQNLVIHPMPQAKFGALPECESQPVSFLDSSSVLTGRIMGWQWRFGDAQVSTDSLPIHTYAKTGTYLVHLIVSTSFGCLDSTTRNQLIWPLPVADFKVTNGCQYDSFSFVDKSVISSGKVTAWYWDFGDGGSSAKQNPRHYFVNDGTYKVMLVSTSAFGCVDTVYHNVIVFPKPNTNWGAVPVCYKFDTKLLDSSTIHTGNIASQSWNFGDGGSSALANPIHHYAKPDTFIVKLVNVSDLGCKDSLSENVIVHPLPVSKWTNSTVCERDSTFFFDKSIIRSGAVNAWDWQFGDGQTDSQQNPGHIYPRSGSYQARLVAISSYGCTDTSKYQTITVYPRSVPSFNAPPVCFKETTLFTDNTSIKLGAKVVSYLWDFGDTTTNILPTPVHTYRYGSVFNVSLTTKTDKGCGDTFRKNVVVYHLPKPIFGPAELCLGDTIHFLDNSISLDGYISRYHWDLGDGDSSNLPAPAHYYLKKGYYDVKLTLYSSMGCTDHLTKRIHILHINPKFTVSDSLTCLNRPILFTDQSTADTTIMGWYWDFGDGSTSTAQFANHAYTIPGHFDISLTITDNTGCNKTLMKRSYIEILDTIPPKPVQIYSVSVDDNSSVTIKYQKYWKYDFGSYVLERDMGGGNFVEIFTSSNPNDTVFKDGGLSTTQNTYSYKVLVKDLCGYVYPPDSSRTHTTMNLTGNKGINKSILDWTPYVGWDTIWRYVIYRQNVYNPLEWDSIGYVRGDSMHFEDTSIICYRTHLYKIKAVELNGFNQISWSDTASVTPLYIPNVLKNEIVRATVEPDNTVLIEWTPSHTKRPWEYILQRSYDNKNFVQIGDYDRKTFHAYDMNVNVNETSYIYRMQVKDSCGYRSGYTNIAKTILLRIDTVLTTGHPALYWTTYEAWPTGVDYYDIQWHDDGSNTWKTVGTVSSVDTSFVDNITSAKQSQYCYRVIGYSRDDNTVLSVSNQACMPTIMHIYVPNAFTPNTDKKNETFSAKGTFVFDYTMEIYNRWGELLFLTHDLNQGWDGKFEGTPVQEGVYIYMIYATGSNGQTYSKPGNITLMR